MFPHIIDAITVPYVAHPLAIRPTGDARRGGRAPLRPVDLMYRGGTSRAMNFGTRARMAEAFAAAKGLGSRVRLQKAKVGPYWNQLCALDGLRPWARYTASDPSLMKWKQADADFVVGPAGSTFNASLLNAAVFIALASTSIEFGFASAVLIIGAYTGISPRTS